MNSMINELMKKIYFRVHHNLSALKMNCHLMNRLLSEMTRRKKDFPYFEKIV
jgi:hypothetical protein